MKGKRVSLTDKQVEKEIERLSGSEAVELILITVLGACVVNFYAIR